MQFPVIAQSETLVCPKSKWLEELVQVSFDTVVLFSRLFSLEFIYLLICLSIICVCTWVREHVFAIPRVEQSQDKFGCQFLTPIWLGTGSLCRLAPFMPGYKAHGLLGIILSFPHVLLYGHWDYTHFLFFFSKLFMASIWSSCKHLTH